MLVKSWILTATIIAVVCHSITSSNAYGEIELECEDETCTKCYKTLATQLLKNDTNYIELQTKFFPSNNDQPDFLTVTYLFDGKSNLETISDQHIWFWSTSTFFFYYPIQVFQFTSLGFSDSSIKLNEVKLHLPESCYEKSGETYNKHMNLLTQRVSYDSWIKPRVYVHVTLN